MPQIELTRGLFAIVDGVDADLATDGNWRVKQCSRTCYAQRRNGAPMHRVIGARMFGADAIVGLFIDHIDGDGLNNSRANLRLATRSQNGCNRTRKVSPKSSRFKGVSWHRKAGKWLATITINGVQSYLGLYSDENEAAAAYAAAAQLLHGDFAAPVVITTPHVALATPCTPHTPRKAAGRSSSYLRVALHRQTGQWQACVKRPDGKLAHVPGLSRDPVEMALFADIVARDIRPHSRLNFPSIVGALPPLANITDEQLLAALSAAQKQATLQTAR